MNEERYSIGLDRPSFDANTLLVLDVWNFNANAILTLTGQTFDHAKKKSVDFQYQLTPSTAGAISTLAVAGLNGSLIWWRIDIETPRTQHGECYAKVSVARGIPTNLAYRYACLWAGYVVTGGGFAFWPGSETEQPTSGAGFTLRQTVGNPGAGADFAFTVPASLAVRLLYCTAGFTTSATAGTRTPRLQMLRGGGVYFVCPIGPIAGVPATQNFVAIIQQGIGTSYVAGAGTDLDQWQVSATAFPLCVSNDQIVTNTTGLDAADVWQSIVLSFDAWARP